MDRVVRKRLEMAVHARDVNRTHPSTDANHASVLNRLDETIKQMEALAAAQVTGVVSKGASTVRRREIRRRLHDGLLRHLVTVARDAAEEKPALTAMFKMPSGNAPNTVYGTVVRTLLEQGVAERELLVKHGLGETLLDDLRKAVDLVPSRVEAGSSPLLMPIRNMGQVSGQSSRDYRTYAWRASRYLTRYKLGRLELSLSLKSLWGHSRVVTPPA